MKKTIITCAILALFSTLYGQDWSSDVYSFGKKYPGYIIKNNGEKVEGYLRAAGRGAIDGVGQCNQNRIVFFTDPKDKKSKVVYKPKDIKGYLIADKYYKTMNYSGGMSSTPIRFVLQQKDGCIATYVWYNHTGRDANGNNIWEDVIVYQKGDEKPIALTSLGMGFAKKMSALVSDYAELSKKVKNKEKGYKMLQIEKIIEEYNAWCKQN